MSKSLIVVLAVIVSIGAAIWYFFIRKKEIVNPVKTQTDEPSTVKVVHAMVGEIEVDQTKPYMGESVTPQQGDPGVFEVLKSNPYTRINPFGLSTKIDPVTAALYDQNADVDPNSFVQAPADTPSADLPVICHKAPYMLDKVCTTAWNKIPLKYWDTQNILVSGYTSEVV